MQLKQKVRMKRTFDDFWLYCPVMHITIPLLRFELQPIQTLGFEKAKRIFVSNHRPISYAIRPALYLNTLKHESILQESCVTTRFLSIPLYIFACSIRRPTSSK